METDYYNNTASEKKYSNEYRHFDSLILHAPAWCTVIFLITLVGLNTISPKNVIVANTGVTPNNLAICFVAVMFLFVIAITHSMYRFRVLQSSLNEYYTSFWASAGTYLQVMVNVQAMCLLVILLLLLSIPLWISFIIGIAALIGVSVYRECSVRIRRLKWIKPSDK